MYGIGTFFSIFFVILNLKHSTSLKTAKNSQIGKRMNI